MTAGEMSGRTVLITGSSGGIGWHTASGLAELGARVLVNGRDDARLDAAVARLREAGHRAEPVLGDVSTAAGVAALAAEVRRLTPTLDVLVNNAGVLSPTRRVTSDGVEVHFAVNVVAPWLLTRELLPLLRAAAPSRVVNVTGGVPRPLRKPRTRDLQAVQGAPALITYSRSKAALEAISLELAEDPDGAGVQIVVVEPGGATTSMTQGMTPATVPAVVRPLWPLFSRMQRPDDGRSAAKAARSSIQAASGDYIGPGGPVYLDAQ
ncbi:MAG: SDR family NAD(P)-dependent oxidoreductase, partial [Dermatophilaceae bacterium]